jgi:dCMP deaminase
MNYGKIRKEMNKKIREAFMDVTYRFAELSYAQRLKVGSIIVKEDRIISIGYNGTPAGWDNTCEDREYMPKSYDPSNPNVEKDYPFIDVDIPRRYRLVTRPEVLHAEQNALMKLARSNESGEGATLFVTHAPCLQCAKNIYQAGITRVFFGEYYNNNDGIDFLHNCGVPVFCSQEQID